MRPNIIHTQTIEFSGPLFIVGMPRSGTKLLRDLLNRHPKIGIPIVESHFIPYMIRKFGWEPEIRTKSDLKNFYQEFTLTTFFWNTKELGQVLTLEELQQCADLSSWSSIFEFILKFYASTNKDDGFIWGDKTPGYINYLYLLKTLYPQARFVHIYRDPRDYALSVKNAWGKSIFRAGYVWKLSLESAREAGLKIGGDYKEIKYEELLSSPEDVLTNLCDFIDCQFLPEMLTLERPSENYGNAKGYTKILEDNFGKYKEHLPNNSQKRLEEIVYPLATELGYKMEFGTHHKPLNFFQLKILNIYDGLASVNFHIKEKGIIQGIQYFILHHIKSSWRIKNA